ncbi:MAG TPA: hypothetical protein VGI91_04925, partial [Steroidobacteraceae bacterium]
PANREIAIRRLIQQLQSDSAPPDLPFAGALRPLTVAAKAWGPVSHAIFVGAVGQPEWSTYEIKPSSPNETQSRSVTVRWEVYRVDQRYRSAMWEIAVDRNGRIWGVKAEAIALSDDR